MRYRLGTLLLVFAIVGAWLATIRMETNLGPDLRSLVWFVLFAVPVFVVAYYRGRVRAFYVGVLLVLVLRTLPSDWPLSDYQPRFGFGVDIAAAIAEQAASGREQAVYSMVYDSINMLGTWRRGESYADMRNDSGTAVGNNKSLPSNVQGK